MQCTRSFDRLETGAANGEESAKGQPIRAPRDREPARPLPQRKDVRAWRTLFPDVHRVTGAIPERSVKPS